MNTQINNKIPAPGSHGAHLAQLVNQLVSQIAPFSSLIITIAACILAAIRIYLLDLVILRSFVNHHVAAGTKVFLIVLTAYPLLAILVGYGTPQTSFFLGSSTTLGDVLLVSSQIFTIMYIFELFYRDKISPVSFIHHVGAVIIAQSAIAMSINYDHESDAVYEFILCFTWGTFDVLAELWPQGQVELIAQDCHALFALAILCRPNMGSVDLLQTRQGSTVTACAGR
ncbi:hypothetical protein NOR_05710 [Metarhizium rileyi]|uniref:Uncharacterized protein n=1 Tax=Metarhizium rileyi (strain RCEF 4871) TaxID=1649241 RepID=A0A167C012_METRR|nr:hypothetical protein NOR_05710 [Metarhizium rileyi RCEF 4871]